MQIFRIEPFFFHLFHPFVYINFSYFSAQPNLYYNPPLHPQQQQQQQHMATTVSSAPVSTFSPPLHQPQPRSTAPLPSSQPQPATTPLIPASEPSKPALEISSPSTLEAQRVTTLLDINNVLLHEIINLQNASRADMPAEVQESSPPGDGSSTTPSDQPKLPPLGKTAIEYALFSVASD